MFRFLFNGVAIGGLTAAAFSGTAATAQDSLPDLVVHQERTRVLSTSCVENAPLAVVRVAIDNIGNETAKDPAATTIGLNPIASAAVEHAHFTAAEARSANNVDAGEIETVVIELGANMVKTGRIGRVTAPLQVSRAPRNWTQQQRLPLRVRQALQRALTNRGFDTNGTEGIFSTGTENAIRTYQSFRGDNQTGILTLSQMDDLLLADDERRFRIVVIADPANRVAETDESNNTLILDTLADGSPLVLDCR